MVPVGICDVSDNNTVMTRAKVIWQKVTSQDSLFGGREGRRGSAMVPFERAMVVSCIRSPL